ncbi:MAG: MATE family efflux transporter, partial [Thermoguttaceae bacterium]|nr:MATE family efflux transporter [Thermoguttaceae bacterium]
MGAGVGAFLKEWWTRPGGGHEVVSLAVPMIISSGSIALMQLTDRVFMTWLDPMAMGATFSAGNFLWFFVAFPFFVAGYCNAFVSQYNGSRQYDKIAPIVWQGIFLGA